MHRCLVIEMMSLAKIIGVVSLIDKCTCRAEPSFGVRNLLMGRVQRLWVTGVEERVVSEGTAQNDTYNLRLY